MASVSSAGDDFELDWWYEAEEECQELTTPPRGAQAFAPDDVSWAEDKHNPDYRHLDAAFAEEEFEFTGADLELIIRENRFEPTREEDRILFGLRGAMLVGGGSASGASLRLRLTRPDHREFRCVIGVYDTNTKQLSGFIGSTVPWYGYVHDYFQRGRGDPRTNLLPSGCYPYFVGPHGKHQIPGCLRLGTGHDKEQQERVAVLRTVYDVRYDTSDIFDSSIPHDNLHPSFNLRAFRSRGCQTVRGGFDAGHTGEWAQFRNAAGLGSRGDNGKRFDYILVTGVEASIASKLRRSGAAGNSSVVLERLTRLRHGSRGELVSSLQRKLSLKPTGVFGAQETKALTSLQRKKFSFADGIYSPDMDARLEFGILKSAPVASPQQVRHIAAGSKRIALVIGNGQYAGASMLGNPTRDADAIAESLKSLDFSVTLLRDANEHAMVQAIVKFKDDLTACHVGLIFYAGHGVQIDGENYVLPIDCNPATLTELRQSSVSLSTLLDPLEESGKVGIIILDCCRDNPFQGRSLSRSLRRGFANLGAPAGTFIAFSTQPGATASDGAAGQHSPFAASLLQHISAEDEDIGQMMRVVRKEVNEKTDGRQLPWDQSSLMVDHFAFKQSNRNIEHRVLSREELDRQQKDNSKQREQEYWALTSTSNSEQLLESFIAQYPDSRHRTEADEKLKEIRAKAEREKARARRLRFSLNASVAALLLLGGIATFFMWQRYQLQTWQGQAYEGQFRLLLTKAREKLAADNADEARSLALAAHRIVKDYDKQLTPELRLDFTNIVTESLKHNAEVALEDSKGVTPKSAKAAFTPDGKYIVWTSDGQGKPLNIADAESGRLLATQPRYGSVVRTLITSPDSTHAALLSERGDAELFALRGDSPAPNYFSVYSVDDIRAITFTRGSTQPLLVGVDKHGTLHGWRFNPKGGLQGPTAQLRRDARVKDRKNEFAISCYDDLCVWVEPDGNVEAARLEPGNQWRPLRATQPMENWRATSDPTAGVEPVAPFIRLGKDQLFAYSETQLVMYEVSVKGDALELNRTDRWDMPALTTIDPDDSGKFFAQYAPDRITPAWTVASMELNVQQGKRQFNTLYYRDYEKQIIDFNFPTKSVVFAPQRGTGSDVLKRRAEAVADLPEYKCIPGCQSINWLGASGSGLVGANRSTLGDITSGGLLYLLQPGTFDAARKLSLRDAAVEAFRKIRDKQEQSAEQARDKEQNRGVPFVRYVAHALDTANDQVLVLMVAPEFAEIGKEATREARVQSAAHVAAFNLKTGRLSTPARVKTGNAADPLLTADFVLSGLFSDKLDSRDTGPPVALRVLVSRGSNEAFIAEHAPRQWQETKAGGAAAGLVRRDGNLLRIDNPNRSDIPNRGKAQSRDWLSEIALVASRVTDFGFINQGSSVFVAYEEGQIDIWDLDGRGKKPRTIVTRVKLTSPQSMVWSHDDKVLNIRDGSTIKRFTQDGRLLDRYAPGRSIGTMVPLANGGLFAVVAEDHTVLPAVSALVGMDKMPHVAEALTPRFIARVDDDVVDNWFLPPETKWFLPSFATKWFTSRQVFSEDRPHPACSDEKDPNYVHECTLLHKYHASSYQRALAVSEHAYRTLEREEPGRGAAFALVDAAAGNPLGLALFAREIGKNDRGLAEVRVRPINCTPDRVAAMRKLFVHALQGRRLIAPFFAEVELQCPSAEPYPADIAQQLRALSARGDPMAFVLLGGEQERDPKDVAGALENYGIASRLLLAQRERLQPKQVFADQPLVESIEQAVNLRRTKLAERVNWPQLSEIFARVETRLHELQGPRAQDGGADGIKTYTVKDMQAALDKADLAASLGKGEAVLADKIGKPVAESLLTWTVRAHYEPVRRANEADAAASRGAYLHFLGAVQRLAEGAYAKAIVELDGALDAKTQQTVLSNERLKELVAHFADLAQLRKEGRPMPTPRRAALYRELAAAAQPINAKVAAQLTTAAAQTYKAAGQIAFNDKDYDRAADTYSKVVELAPKDREGYMQRGTAYEFKKSYELAIADYTEALKLSPKWDEVYGYRGGSYKALGKYDEALADYSKAVEIDPRDSNHLLGRGRLHLVRGAPDSAVEDFSKALELRPTWDEGFRFRGIAWILRGEFDKAVDDFTSALKLDPNDDNYYNGRAWAHFKAGRLDLAVKDAQQAVSIARFSPAESADTLGQILLAQGKTEEANAAFTRAQARKPGLKLTLEDTLRRLAP